ncbi:MAG: hypothetical protein AAF799_45580 [Myxococcota bacterium]
MPVSARIEAILAKQRSDAEQRDWSTAKGIVAAVGAARDALERRLAQPGAPPSAEQLADAVEAAKAEFRELWEDEAGYGLATLGEIAAALRSGPED